MKTLLKLLCFVVVLEITSGIAAAQQNVPLGGPAGLISDATPIYSWTGVANATDYFLWVNDSSGNVFRQWYAASSICAGVSCSVEPAQALREDLHTWWVQPRTGSTLGAWSAGVQFRITQYGAAPAGTTLESPSSLIPERSPTFRWAAVAATTSYYLWINGASGKVFAQWYDGSAVCSASTCSAKPSVSLSDGSYTWWVQTRNGAGEGPWSAPMDVRVSTFATRPGVPQLVSPNGSIPEQTPTYVWKVVSEALDYYLWIDGPGGNVYKEWFPASRVCGQTTCSARPALTLEGAHKFWVQARNGSGTGNWSAASLFSVDLPKPPAKPLTVAPDGMVYNDQPVYVWSTVSEAADYYLWVNGPAGTTFFTQWYGATSALCPGATCSVKPPVPLANGAHKFWVQASNGAGTGPWSNAANFSVKKPSAPPARASLVLPSGAISEAKPTYRWQAVAECDEYHLWINGSTGKVLEQWYRASGVCSGTDCSMKPELALPEGDYTWWIRAKNGAGEGGWSAAMNFRYSAQTGPPPAATSISPTGTTAEPTPTYSWNKVSAATDYYLWVNGASGNVFKKWFPSSASLCPGAVCSIKPELSLPKGAYTWWIQTKNALGEGGWSPALHFTMDVVDKTPPTVALTSPTLGAVVSSTVTVSATASDNVGVVGLQFLLDGQNLGAERQSAPYSVSWTTTSVANGTHTLGARARDAAGNQTTATSVSVTVQNADLTPPTASIVTPAPNATVTGVVQLSANATDNVAVAGVQFKLNGQNLGPEDTQSPYTASWDTATSSEGSHTLTAVSRDTSGNTMTSTPVMVTVSRVLLPGNGWTQLPGTKLRSVCPPNGFGGSGYPFTSFCRMVTEAWNSAVFDTKRNRLIVWGGGHGDYYGNELYALNLGSMTVERLTDPALPLPQTGCPEGLVNDSQPNSRHTYDGIAYMAHVDRMFVFGGGLAPCGYLSKGTWTFNFATSKWEKRNPSGTIPHPVPGIASAYDPVTGHVYLHDDQYLYAYDFATDRYTQLSGSNPIDYHLTAVIDPVRREFLLVGNGDVFVYDISSGSTYARKTLATTGGDAIVNSIYPGLAYHPPTGKIVAWNGGDAVYSLDSSSRAWTATVSPAGPGPALPNGTFERWSYSEASNAFVVVNGVDSDAFRFTFNPANTDITPPSVSISSPAPGSVLQATVSISAAASDNVGVVGVQFLVDGKNIGLEVKSPPYFLSWNTVTVANGAHELKAVARDAAGNLRSSSISVTVSNSGNPVPRAAENTITIHNTSGVHQSNRPVSVSRVFRQGDISDFAQAMIGSTQLLTQNDVKNRWTDGSLKFAIVSFVVPDLPVGGSVVVEFSNQATGNNTGFLTQSQMLESRFDFDARIEMTGGALRSVSARAMLAAGHFRYWLQGPIVTAVIVEDRTPARAYDQDFGDGSKALHPIFEAWFYNSTSAVDVGYTMENTWASSDPAKGMRDLSYSLTLRSGLASPTIELNHPIFKHIGRSRWHKRYWIGQDPSKVRIDHNSSYLVSTQAIPHYDPNLQVAPAVVSSQYTSWSNADKTLDGDASGIGNFKKALAMGGANDWIGLMSTWDVVYLLTMDDRMLEKSLGNADLAGRIPWHFREVDTLAGAGKYFDAPGGTVDTFGRVVSVNARKTVSLWDLAQVCGAAHAANEIRTGQMDQEGWATTRDHMPELAYVPYLMTGRYYYLEELQYQAAFIVAHKTGCYSETWNRQGEAGYLMDSELRGDAWGLRTLAYGAFLSPDGTPEQVYFDDKIKNNVALWEGERDLALSYSTKQSNWNWANVNRRDPSPLGVWKDRGPLFIQSPLRKDGYLAGAASPWEENFLVCSLGMARQFGYRTDALLEYAARLRFNQVLNPDSSIYLLQQYRIPTRLASTGDWIRSWPDYTNAFDPVPTNWSTESTADHGYGFIALAAVSFLEPYTVDGYTGSEAWTVFKAEKPEQERLANESPKWAIVPIAR